MSLRGQLYGLLRAATWKLTIVSVGHRSTLRNFHDDILNISRLQPIGRSSRSISAIFSPSHNRPLWSPLPAFTGILCGCQLNSQVFRLPVLFSIFKLARRTILRSLR